MPDATDAILSGANTAVANQNPGSTPDQPNPQPSPAPAMPTGNTNPTVQNLPATFKGNLVAGLKGQRYKATRKGSLLR
jgi:hypothetical protein